MKGAEIIIKSLIKEKVEIIFGYPGGANMPIYDALYDYQDKIRHILVRHEQGAVHAAEGYARASGKPGVCLVTSGPGATNLVTGIADAMMDSVPLVCITGQVAAEFLGTDAFQETDVIGITTPITKWNYQITKASEITKVFARAFYIATHGRPGPVVIDITKNAQFEESDFSYPEDFSLKKYENINKNRKNDLKEAADILNNADRPLIIAGHGVIISKAEKLLIKLAERGDIPIATTLHGVSTIPFDHRLFVGMAGMHGRYGVNKLTNETDVIFAIGMRFDDRVTGKLSDYAPQAKVIHVDIDESEINKNIKTILNFVCDCKVFLEKFVRLIKYKNRQKWLERFKQLNNFEEKTLNDRLLNNNKITMDQVFNILSEITNGQAIIVADVGQNQMFAARFYNYKKPNSFISSGGLGTMGFALPAAIGVKIGCPDDLVIAVIGDGGFQMTMQELGIIMQEKLPVKILILNNEYLGMVRQWQELFFQKRYSFTYLKNPDFLKIAQAYGIKADKVIEKNQLKKSLERFIKEKGPYLLEIKVEKEDNIFPMVPTGVSVSQVRLK